MNKTSWLAALLVGAFLASSAITAESVKPNDKSAPALIDRLPSSADLEKFLNPLRSAEVVRLIGDATRSGRTDFKNLMMVCMKRADADVAQAALRALPNQTGIEDDDRFAVRMLIASKDPNVAIAAIRCATELDDEESLGAIADRLGPDRRLSDEAHQALVKLAGRDCGSSKVAWQEWFASRDEKAKIALAAIEEKFREGTPAAAKTALSELSQAEVSRADKRALATSYLDNADPDVANAANQILGKVDASRARTAVTVAAPEVIDRAATAKAPPSPTTVTASMIPGGSDAAKIVKPNSAIAYAMLVGSVMVGLVGALGLLVFMMRTREAAIRLTKRLTKRVVAGTRRMGKGGMNLTKRIGRAIKKKITFTK